jgi:uncharacterized membrane protein
MTTARKDTSDLRIKKLEKDYGDLSFSVGSHGARLDGASRALNDLKSSATQAKLDMASLRDGYQEWTNKVNTEGNVWFGWCMVLSILAAVMFLVVLCHTNWLHGLEAKIESQRDVAERLLEADETDLNKAAAVEIARLRATVEALSKNESHT